MRTRWIALCVPAVVAAACHDHDQGGSGEDAGHAHAEKGPHGGTIVDVGKGVAHLEMLHDHDTGTLTIHVLDKDAETPRKVAVPPEVKLATDAGPKILRMTAKGTDGSTFEVTDDALKKDHGGRVSIEIGGKIYQPDLAHDH